jgi:N-methylhydantoinase A
MVGEMPKPRLAPIQPPTGGSKATKRAIRLFGRTVVAAVMERSALEGTIEGPAIINQMDTTTLVPPGWRGRRVDAGALVLERKTAP